MNEELMLQIHNTDRYLQPSDIVKLGRFDDESWIVGYGWFSFGGNRPWCGWYLTSMSNNTVKPLLLTDLDDIYVIQKCYRKEM